MRASTLLPFLNRFCPSVLVSVSTLALMTGCAGSRHASEGPDGFTPSPAHVTLAAVTEDHPPKRSRKPKSRIVRVSNDSEPSGGRPSPGSMPPVPAPSEWKIEKVTALVGKGKYLGLTGGRLRFQPANLEPNAPTPALLEDAVIGSTVQAKLINEGGVEPGSFEVKSRGGVVQIRPANGGATTSKMAKAINYALEVSGVREVQVEIPPPAPPAPNTASSDSQQVRSPTPVP